MNDTITIRKKTLFWIALLGTLGLYFHVFYLYPRESLQRFALRVTHKHECGPTQPATYANETGGVLDRPRPAYAPLCMPAKLQMTDPGLLFLAYPVGFLFVDIAGMKYIPETVTPNMLSFTNPIFGHLGGYLLLTGAMQAAWSAWLWSWAWWRGKSRKDKGEENLSRSMASHEELHEASIGTPRVRLPFSDDTYIQVDSSEKDCNPSWSFSNQDLSMNRMRLAAFCMYMRGVCDTMDGTLARAHQELGFKTTSWIPMDGATVDIVTDIIGAGIWWWAIFFHFCFRKFTMPSLPKDVPALRCRSTDCCGLSFLARARIWITTRLPPWFLARVVVFFACLHIVLRGLFWEKYIRTFGALFDNTTDADLLILSRSWMVQLVYFFWATACCDAMIGFTMLAACFDFLWPMCKWMLTWGWVWSVGIVVYTECVYRYALLVAAGEGRSAVQFVGHQ